MKVTRLVGPIFLILSLSCAIGAAFWLETTKVGNAYELSNPSNLVFTETKTDVVVNNQIREQHVVYRDKKLNLLADKKVNFSKSNFHPDYSMEDKISGKQESVTKSGNSFMLTYKKDKNSVSKTKTISIPEPVVCDAGFSNMVIQNFDKLLKGEEVVFNLIVAERFDYYSFRYSKSKLVKIGGKDAIVIKMESDSFLIRQLVDPMFLTYDISSKTLVQYEGVSTITNENGERYVVKIVYQ